MVDTTLDRTSTSIVLSFTTKDGNKVEFEMTNFVDIGQDGFIDEFTGWKSKRGHKSKSG